MVARVRSAVGDHCRHGRGVDAGRTAAGGGHAGDPRRQGMAPALVRRRRANPAWRSRRCGRGVRAHRLAPRGGRDPHARGRAAAPRRSPAIRARATGARLLSASGRERSDPQVRSSGRGSVGAVVAALAVFGYGTSTRGWIQPRIRRTCLGQPTPLYAFLLASVDGTLGGLGLEHGASGASMSCVRYLGISCKGCCGSFGASGPSQRSGRVHP